MHPEGLFVPADQWAILTAHLETCLPREGCGLLAGRGGLVSRVIPIRNAERSLTRFRMDPQEQVEAILGLEEDGLDLVAIYHSHPAGPPRPSAIDVAEAAYPDVFHVVLTHTREGWLGKAFRIAPGILEEVELRTRAEGGRDSARAPVTPAE